MIFPLAFLRSHCFSSSPDLFFSVAFTSSTTISFKSSLRISLTLQLPSEFSSYECSAVTSSSNQKSQTRICFPFLTLISHSAFGNLTFLCLMCSSGETSKTRERSFCSKIFLAGSTQFFISQCHELTFQMDPAACTFSISIIINSRILSGLKTRSNREQTLRVNFFEPIHMWPYDYKIFVMYEDDERILWCLVSLFFLVTLQLASIHRYHNEQRKDVLSIIPQLPPFISTTINGRFCKVTHLIYNRMIRGTTHDQDARFCDKTKKMIEKSEWPDKYDIKIDLTKVDLQLIKVWIEKRLILLLGEEDDIISGTIISIIDQNLEKEQKLNAKVFHVAISGFLIEKTLIFVSQLWDLLDEAQRSARGIPESLLEEKLKGQEQQRRKLDELNAKRYKINSHKFNNVVKRFTNNRESPKRDRSERVEKEHKKRKDRSKSRSHDKKKKHRNSEEKKKHRSRSRDGAQKKKNKNQERQGKSRKHRRSESSSQPRPKKSQKQRKESPTPKSDSSGVISSSSNDN